MTKISGDILSLISDPSVSVYGISTSPGKIILKAPSFAKGKTPAHLEKYTGQTAPLPKACKGKKGMGFVKCMRDKAKEMGIAKK